MTPCKVSPSSFWNNHQAVRYEGQRRDIPYGDLAHDIILSLQLLHLPVSYGAVFAFKKLLFNLVPGTDILLSQGYFHPVSDLVSRS